MKKTFLTDTGKEMLATIAVHYPSLFPYYNTPMGNFSFTPIEFAANALAIAGWMQDDDTFIVVCEDATLYLTNSF
jgi:hypothetical protein